MPERAVFERSRRELSLDVSVGVRILLVVEQSSLESQSRRYVKAPVLTVWFNAQTAPFLFASEVPKLKRLERRVP